MKTKELKRSNAPIFWMLFGGGGMLSALIGPALILLTGILVPMGIIFSPEMMNYENMLWLAQNLIGKGFLLAVIVLFLWHAAHRIFHSLHEIGIHGGLIAKLCTYGLAFAGSGIAALSLLGVGFGGLGLFGM